MRLIDADELKESLKDLKAESHNQKYVQGLQDAIDYYFPQIIDDMPTVDVQPVALKDKVTPDKEKGHWVKREVRGQEMLCCSKCGSDTGTIYEYDFCPHCGIEMDGDNNG